MADLVAAGLLVVALPFRAGFHEVNRPAERRVVMRIDL